MENPLKIEIEAGERLLVRWEDDSVSELSAAQLRAACSCAGCRSDNAGSRTTISLTAPGRVTIQDAHLVGSYGINLTFAPDQHRTGIFTFDQLKDLAGRWDTNT